MPQPDPLQHLLLEIITEMRDKPLAKLAYLSSYADIMRLRDEGRRWFIDNLGLLRLAYQHLDAKYIKQETRVIAHGSPRVGTPDDKQSLLVELERLTLLEFELELRSLKDDKSIPLVELASRLSQTKINIPAE